MVSNTSLQDKISPSLSAYDEMIDLIARGGGPNSIIEFRPSENAQARAHDLIEKKRDGTITTEESDLLFHFTELEHILRMAKIRARQVLQKETATSHSSH